MTDPGRGIYVFCVTRTTAPLPALAGLDRAPLTTESAAELAAVTCDVDLDDWTGEGAEARLQDLDWIAPRALHHERVNEEVMREAPLLPLRFGSLFSSTAALRAWLERHERTISRFLDATSEVVEWSIKGWIDAAILEGQLLADDPRFAALPAAKGARYLQEKRLRREAARRVSPWIAEVEAALRERLEGLVVLDRRLPLPRRDLSDRKDEPAFHLAVLCRRGDAERLTAAIDELTGPRASFGLAVEVIGPWPPYSFSPELAADEDEPSGDG